jgi:hypothetical protein
MLTILVEHEPIFRRSTQQQMLFESLLVRFALMDHTVQLEEVLKAAADESGAGGVSARRAPPARAARGPGRDAVRDVPPARRAAEQVEAEPASAADVPPAKVPAARTPGPAPAPLLADAPRREAAPEALDLNRLAERWDDIVAMLRAEGRGLVAQLLEEATPAAVTATGVVTLDAESDLTVQGLGEAEPTVIEALGRHFEGITRLVVRTAGSAGRRRYDAESVKAERTDSLRKGSPLLSAAIDALDLELIE